jgi:hypothetical protein
MTPEIGNYLKGVENFIIYNGYYYDKTRGNFVHRIVMEMKFGNHLASYQEVHHIDGDKLNNRPANLYVCSRQKHQWIHIMKLLELTY